MGAGRKGENVSCSNPQLVPTLAMPIVIFLIHNGSNNFVFYYLILSKLATKLEISKSDLKNRVKSKPCPNHIFPAENVCVCMYICMYVCVCIYI